MASCRPGNSAMIRDRSASDSDDQPAISSSDRAQPTHKRESGSITQTLMQGLSMARGDPVSQRVLADRLTRRGADDTGAACLI